MDQSGSNNPAYKHGHTNGGAIRELQEERLIDVKKVQVGRAKINILTTAVTSCSHNGANQ